MRFALVFPYHFTMKTCDWRERPLSAEQLLYASYDSHYLVPLWRLLRARMLAEDTDSPRDCAQRRKDTNVIEGSLHDDAPLQREDAKRPSNGHAEEDPVRLEGDAVSEYRVADSPSQPCHRRTPLSVGLSMGDTSLGSGRTGVTVSLDVPKYSGAPGWESSPMEQDFPTYSHRGQRSLSDSPLDLNPKGMHESDSGSGGSGAGIESLPHGRALQANGVSLLWNAVNRAQLAASVLWQPKAEPRREDAHKDRHFRRVVKTLPSCRWTHVNARVYEDIYLWRDRTARCLDDGPSYVCSMEVLIDVALALPTTLSELRQVTASLSPVLGSRNSSEAIELVRVIRGSLDLHREVCVGGRLMTQAGRQKGKRWGEGAVTRFERPWNITSCVFALGFTMMAIGIMIGISVERSGRAE